MRNKLSCAALAILGMCGSVFGAVAIELEDIGVAAPGSEVVLGEWNGGFDECLAKANEEHIPMFAMWSNTGCSHCEAVYTTIMTERFIKWRRGEGSNIGKIILLLMKGGSEGNGYSESSAGYDWAWGPGHTLGLYPFTVMYWNKKDGTVIRQHKVGEALTGYTGGEVGTEELIRNLETTFAGWEGVITSPTVGSTFVAGTSANARLEIEVGHTQYVDVPLVRTNGVAVAGTNYLSIAANGTKLKTDMPVVWANGTTNMSTRINLSTLGYSGKAGDILTLTLGDDTKTNIVANSLIAYVAEQPLSLENPLWIGERTASTLQAGEWTMDLDVATNRTARQSGAAYTLVAAVGSLWCPDCKRLATNLTDKVVFKDWVAANNVALRLSSPMPRSRTRSTKGGSVG